MVILFLAAFFPRGKEHASASESNGDRFQHAPYGASAERFKDGKHTGRQKQPAKNDQKCAPFADPGHRILRLRLRFTLLPGVLHALLCLRVLRLRLERLRLLLNMDALSGGAGFGRGIGLGHQRIEPSGVLPMFLHFAEKLHQKLGDDVVPAQTHDQQNNACRPECAQQDHVDDP